MCRGQFILLAVTLAISSVSPSVQARERALAVEPLRIVATLPVLKDWAQQIGGPHVHVTTLLSGYESEHTYSPKPSDILAVRRAQVLLEIGAGLEAWVSSLIRNAGNQRLQIVTTSRGIALIREHHPRIETADTPHVASGNPHVWLDPHSAATMVRHIADALIKADPKHADDYQHNLSSYLRQLDELSSDMQERLRPVGDRRIIVHHPAWPYFARRFDLQVVGTIIGQPGAEPSAQHLRTLVSQIRNDRLKVIVSEAQLNQKFPRLLAEETGARVVILTTLPGALPGTETYLDMLRYNVIQLAQALEQA